MQHFTGGPTDTPATIFQHGIRLFQVEIWERLCQCARVARHGKPSPADRQHRTQTKKA